MIVFQEEHCEIIQINTQTIKLKLAGFLKVKNLTAITTFMDAFMKTNSCNNLLVDQSELKVLSKDVQEYLAKTITATQGFRRIAIVQAEDVFAKAAFDKLHKEVHHNGVTREFFYAEKTALEWLLSAVVNPV